MGRNSSRRLKGRRQGLRSLTYTFTKSRGIIVGVDSISVDRSTSRNSSMKGRGMRQGLMSFTYTLTKSRGNITSDNGISGASRKRINTRIVRVGVDRGFMSEELLGELFIGKTPYSLIGLGGAA